MALARRRLPPDAAANTGSSRSSAGAYFASEQEHLKFIKTGSTMLDNALGGGFVIGRIANIIGDKATGKTLLAIEACANFARDYPRGKIYYRERESAFDTGYAATMGLPTERIDFGKREDRFTTVEGMFDDLDACIKKQRGPGLYILDSLDSLSDEAEQGRKITDGSFGAAKAKKMSEMFRRLNDSMEDSELALIIISQIRDKIGVMFGEKTSRTGGKALDFYASHIVKLAHLGFIKKTRAKVQRVIGANVRARISKNKVGPPQREATFDIMYGYGVDDLGSCIDWLTEIDGLAPLGLTKATVAHWLQQTNALPDNEYRIRVDLVAKHARERWKDIERGFLPVRRKYAND